MAKRNPAKMANGKAIVMGVPAGRCVPGLISLDDLKDAIYYLDGTLFLPTGGAKAGRALRAEAKKRGVL